MMMRRDLESENEMMMQRDVERNKIIQELKAERDRIMRRNLESENEMMMRRDLESENEMMMQRDLESENERMMLHFVDWNKIIQELKAERERIMRRYLESENEMMMRRDLKAERERIMRRNLESENEMMMRRDQESENERMMLHFVDRNKIIQELKAERERIMRRNLEAENERMMRRYAIHNADTSEEKMIVEKQEGYLNYRRSCHGTKLLKSSFSFAPFFWPCAGGTGHGSGQPEHQGHSEIYPFTLNVVSNCPGRGEYIQRSLARCADVCGSYMQDGNCAYHCMRDSSKTKLVEFCAKPKPLFDYCPEYDPVDQTIQKDLATLCNSTFSRNYYNSSDFYFCNPDNCLQLHESSVRSGATSLTTLMNETTEMNGGDSLEWILPLLVVLAALILPIIIGSVLRVFVKRGIFTARSHKMTKKRNRNEKQYGYTGVIIRDIRYM